jgi:hypothetical protein
MVEHWTAPHRSFNSILLSGFGTNTNLTHK